MTMPTTRELVLTAPPSQLDPHLKSIAEDWADEPAAIELLELLDKCTYLGAASGFFVQALSTFLDAQLQAEGKTLDDLLPLATWRSELE